MELKQQYHNKIKWIEIALVLYRAIFQAKTKHMKWVIEKS